MTLEDQSLALIDHHVHGAVTGPLDRPGMEALLTEGTAPSPAAPVPPAPSPAAPSMFDSQVGFGIRRWCAPLLDLEPSAPAEEYLRRRAELGPAEVNQRMLRAAKVDAWLVDTGYQSDRIQDLAQVAEASGAPAHEIVRLEAVAEQVAASGPQARGFAEAFAYALASATVDAVGLKSIVAYRYGFDFDPARPDAAEVRSAAGRWLRAIAAAAARPEDPAARPATPAARLDDPVLLRHVIWAGIDTGLPVQFHVGFGDTDVRLHRSDPSLLTDFLLATQDTGTPVMLLHCYPHHRQAGYLANVFPHVYMDLGAVLNHVGARSAAVLAEALELTPFHKMLYSSDAFGLPELHYLGALGFRRDLARVIGGFVADGAWTAADADRVAGLIGSGNARRVYRLATA